MRFLAGLLLIVAVCNLMPTQTDQTIRSNAIDPAANLKDFQVIEFRRYTIKPGGREDFTKYFETYFPGAIEQAGAITPVLSSSARIKTASHGFVAFTRLTSARRRTPLSMPGQFGRSIGKR